MTQLYKLKKEARQFFKSWENEIKSLEWWNKQIVPIQLLEEVSNVYISYGKNIGEDTKSLRGWQTNGEKAQFDFTVSVIDISYKEYEKVSIPYVMDEIQKVLDKIFKPY
jgi:hypothetical protein